MNNYTAFNPKHYSDGQKGTIQLTNLEIEKFFDFKMKKFEIAEEKIMKAIQDKPADFIERYKKGYSDKKKKLLQEKNNFYALNGNVYAYVDFYLERYLRLKNYDDVPFCLSFMDSSSFLNIDETIGHLFMFIEDKVVIDKLNQYLSDKEKSKKLQKELKEKIEKCRKRLAAMEG